MPALNSRSPSDLNSSSGIRFPSECGIDRRAAGTASRAGSAPLCDELRRATPTDGGGPIVDAGSTRNRYSPRTQQLLQLESMQQWIHQPLAQSDLPPRDRLYCLGQLITIH